MTILGLDIGGANIKAADINGHVVCRPFAIWNHPERLTDELALILQEFPRTNRLAVTMTAELADCFSAKAEGVRFILDSVDESARQSFPIRESRPNPISPVELTDPGEPVIVWTTEGYFVSSTVARECVMKVAAANWHALATWCGDLVPDGHSLLVDIGTTTTDIIPLLDGVPRPVGLTDLARLQSGELSYSGVWRTPLCAVAHSVPFREGYCSLASELFATTLDIHLLLDHLPEEIQNVETSNGKPATKAAAHDRIARMLCCDREEIPFAEAVQIARFLADVQRQRLAGSLERVLRSSLLCQTVVISGSGSFLARQLVFENRHTTNAKVISLSDQFSSKIATAACAYAIAQLASRSK